MARPNLSNKRDIEKQKQQKRLEKQKRKEERKANGTASFEDMIAYVDANGMLSSTPDEGTKEEVSLESIEIAIPKKEEEPEQTVLHGRVEFFNESKGFGFIKDINSTEKYFFHVSRLIDPVDVNTKVTFELERGARGMCAVNIKKS